jgi:hypothetical protein
MRIKARYVLEWSVFTKHHTEDSEIFPHLAYHLQRYTPGAGIKRTTFEELIDGM